MNGRPLTDAQISGALRARLPERAQAGLRERVLEAVETTAQQRALPSFLGAVADADPVARRRSLLIAAALLVAAALASAAAVGAWRLLERDPVQELNLETPTDLRAFILSSHDRMPQLPPVAITTLHGDATSDRIYVGRSGSVRIERYAAPDATQPGTSMILSGTRFGRTLTVGPNLVWLEQDDAIGEDPRVYILSHLTGLELVGGSGCDPNEVGNGTSATGWRYIGADTVARRPAHHVACGGADVWIDDTTRLILRTRDQDLDDAGNPVPGTIQTTEVTKIEFGEQPAALFAFAPPNGVAAMSSEAYEALCPHGDTVAFLEYPPCAGTPGPAVVAPTPEPAPSPTPSVLPKSSECAVPSRDPGQTTGPLAWTQANLQQDWPAPVRPEPAGGASVLPMPPTYIDPAGDAESDVFPCVDIRDMTVDTFDVTLNLVANPRPDVDPSEAWIAYGVVVDENRDGVPDWRYGIDNLPRPAGDEQGHHRAWRTDLHTGRTESADHSSDFGKVGETFFSTRYPAGTSPADARFSFGDRYDVTGGGSPVTEGIEVDMPLYAWASIIVNGRVVATDYAPNAGWLLPSPGAKPGGTYVLERNDRFPLRISMTVPDGWNAPFGCENGLCMRRDDGNHGDGLDFMIVNEPPQIACDRSGGTNEMHLGPSVDDLVSFLAGLQTKTISDKTGVALKISENTDVTVDGYSGRYLEYTATVRDDCSSDMLVTGDQAWILDVDGVRLVIHGSPQIASETVKAELRRIVESIDIGP